MSKISPKQIDVAAAGETAATTGAIPVFNNATAPDSQTVWSNAYDGGLQVPIGDDAARPANSEGMIRWSNEVSRNYMEINDGSNWSQVLTTLDSRQYIVWQPSGTDDPANNTYTDFADVYSVAQSNNGITDVYLDNTFAALNIPAGAYDVSEIIWKANGDLFGGGTSVNIPSGVTFTGVEFVADGFITFVVNSVSSIYTLAADDTLSIQLRFGAAIDCVGAPFVTLTGLNSRCNGFLFSGGNINNSGSPVVDVTTNSATLVRFQLFASSIIRSNTLRDVAGATSMIITYIEPSANSQNQGLLNTTETIALSSSAANVDYNNSAGSLVSSTVKDALDELSTNENTFLNNTATGAISVDWDDGKSVELICTGNITLSFTNVRQGRTLRLWIQQDGVGGRTVTFPAGVLWDSGVAPVVPAGANQSMLLEFNVFSDTAAPLGIVKGTNFA